MTLTQGQLEYAHAAIAYHVQVLRALPYPEYLKTTHWQWKRYRKLALAGRRCARCRSTALIEVHHLTYERLGAERLADLIVLCDNCHREKHGTILEKIQ